MPFHSDALVADFAMAPRDRPDRDSILGPEGRAVRLAARRLAEVPDRARSGIASRGRTRGFGRLDGACVARHDRSGTPSEPDDPRTSPNGRWNQRRRQAARPMATA